MDNIKNNFFEGVVAFALTTAGIYRIAYHDEIREKETATKIISDFDENIIMIYELSAIFFIFYTNDLIKKIYLLVYLVAAIYISFKYISNINFVYELRKLVPFTPTIDSIVEHLVFMVILVYLIVFK